ncbi:hypothetical protein GCM10010145_40690 [Streptomyces ruber]|uniref:NlpC/P60 domain-containing protein n=2 Tax=Streptomyces TaxID=1883 RepID=A0A918BG86_9ACTN|nr:C40 family peptidase [Streptomyces ruber]GGQ66809.1 hypothetical protein GCM10010145_40690 [Streptomyces ruber]
MGSHRRLAPSGFDRGISAALCALSAAAALGAAVPAAAAPSDHTRAEVERLHEEAERATEAYNKADERADTLRRQVGDAQDRIARQQEHVNTMREAIGFLAGAQYRSGGLDPSLALLLSEDPDDYLDKAATLDRISAHQADELDELQRALRTLSQEREEATGKLAELERSRRTVARHKRSVERKLAQARRLLNSLTEADRAAYDRASRASRAGRDEVPGPPAGDAAAVAPNGRAGAAVAAVRSALGKPYMWGASGPHGFDCSGLMQWSYARAGIGLPRTSQAQQHAGRQVPLSEALPGDLVIYRSDASHVGMYVGGGQVIHAPYPGAPVRSDPVGMMPIAGVTRV